MRTMNPVPLVTSLAALLFTLAACSGPATGPGGEQPNDPDPPPPESFDRPTLTTGCEEGGLPVLQLSWSPPGQATAYDVYRDGELLRSGLPADTTTYRDRDVEADGTYVYHVVARGSGADMSSGQATHTVPRQACHWTAIAAGGRHTLGLRYDGTVWAWGANDHGQLGDGSAGGWRAEPRQVGDVDSVTAIAAGTHHSLALTADGTVWAWGSNEHGRLGDGTSEQRAAPVPVTGLDDAGAVESIHAGAYSSYALLQDGTVMAWGNNSFGQLGTGTGDTEEQLTPAPVPGLGSAETVSVRGYHVLARLEDGTMVGWGSNLDRQLASTDYNFQYSPAPVSALAGLDVKAAAAGTYHSLVLLEDGTILGWGANSFRQLGNDSSADRIAEPTPVTDLPASGIAGVASGYAHSVALLDGGTLLSWGSNRHGELGPDAEKNQAATPVPLPGLSGVTDVSPGIEHYTLALLGDGTIWAWGNNNTGQLGYETQERHSTTPRQVIVP